MAPSRDQGRFKVGCLNLTSAPQKKDIRVRKAPGWKGLHNYMCFYIRGQKIFMFQKRRRVHVSATRTFVAHGGGNACNIGPQLATKHLLHDKIQLQMDKDSILLRDSVDQAACVWRSSSQPDAS